MHRREKKETSYLVTGVTEMDDGHIRTWHVPPKPKNIASGCEAVMNVKVNICKIY